jgi:signal transduction histidine kinase
MTKVTCLIPDGPRIPGSNLIELGRMSLFQRHRWFVAAVGVTLAFASVSLTAHKSDGLTAFADVSVLVVMLAGVAITLVNAGRRPPQERSFWALMFIGFALWAVNQVAWVYWECRLHLTIPDPFFFDIILFFHMVPMIAAVAWRPDLTKKQQSVHLSALNFLTLLGWWVFLYAFLVFPHQYVLSNVTRYDFYYDRLYGLENFMLLGVLALAAWTSSGGWRRLYVSFLAASALYAVNSQLLDRAAANNSYYSGCPYDIPLVGTVAWMVATAASAPDWELSSTEFRLDPRWKKIVPQLAMLAILSLPVLGLWTIGADKSESPVRVFRVCAVLSAMVFLGAFVFMRQYFQDQALMALLRESRRGYDSQKRLQTQLVQKEKLATLGNLVAGAAHEINHPLTAVMNCSEQLWARERLTDEQNALLRKIVNHAQRTRDLVANLLSFAQQAPGEKALVDLNMLLHRAVQMLEPRYPGGKIRVEISVEPALPRIRGNVNQLFQVFIEIAENAMDALQEAGGGCLTITAGQKGSEAVIQFSDSGPGIREPQRVFDPFYTTKPVGKGTGLGLSVVYGVIQDHGGLINCQNKPEGGALFTVRFAVTAESAVQVAGAAGA